LIKPCNDKKSEEDGSGEKHQAKPNSGAEMRTRKRNIFGLPDVSIEDLVLDLDTEPSSSEDETTISEDGEESVSEQKSYVISLPSRLSHGDPRQHQQDRSSHSDKLHSLESGGRSPQERVRDEVSAVPSLMTECTVALKNILESKQPSASLEKEGGPQWSITKFDQKKNVIYISSVCKSGQVFGSINGQVIPKKLALYASHSSPSGSSRTNSSEPSPLASRESIARGSIGDTAVSDANGGDLDSLSLSSLEPSVKGSLARSSGNGEEGRGVEAEEGVEEEEEEFEEWRSAAICALAVA